MPRRVLISALAAAATVIPFPAAAIADSSPSAGDSQYVDPLGATHTSSSSSSPSSGSASGAGSSTPTASSSSATPAASTAPSSSSPGSAASGSGGSGDPRGHLPYTGVDTELIALIGLGLAGGGLALRRRCGPARG